MFVCFQDLPALSSVKALARATVVPLSRSEFVELLVSLCWNVHSDISFLEGFLELAKALIIILLVLAL